MLVRHRIALHIEAPFFAIKRESSSSLRAVRDDRCVLHFLNGITLPVSEVTVIIHETFVRIMG
jgi:hypothetical protein